MTTITKTIELQDVCDDFLKLEWAPNWDGRIKYHTLGLEFEDDYNGNAGCILLDRSQVIIWKGFIKKYLNGESVKIKFEDEFGAELTIEMDEYEDGRRYMLLELLDHENNGYCEWEFRHEEFETIVNFVLEGLE